MRVQVGDTRLYFDVEGASLVPDGPWMRERPTIVLLHSGPGFDHQIFRAHLGPELAVIAQVVYLDLRGHGRSDPASPEEMRLDVWAEDVHGFCAAVGIERPVVLGHGFGSLVAIRYATLHPEHPGALVLSAPYARIVPDRIVDAFARLGEPGAGEVARQFYDDPAHATLAEYLRRCYPLIVRSQDSAEELTRSVFASDVLIEWTRTEGLSVDLRDELSRIAVPTLLVAGEDDPFTPLAAAREVADSLPSSVVRFRSFPGVRHPVFREAHPHALAEVRELLERIAEA